MHGNPAFCTTILSSIPRAWYVTALGDMGMAEPVVIIAHTLGYVAAGTLIWYRLNVKLQEFMHVKFKESKETLAFSDTFSV